jgi:hypothetical protein
LRLITSAYLEACSRVGRLASLRALLTLKPAYLLGPLF